MSILPSFPLYKMYLKLWHRCKTISAKMDIHSNPSYSTIEHDLQTIHHSFVFVCNHNSIFKPHPN